MSNNTNSAIYTNDVNNNIVTGNGCEKYGKVFATVSANSS